MSGARAAGPDGIDAVLLAQPPAFGEADAAARWEQDGVVTWLRAYDLLPGRSRFDPLTLGDPALVAWGQTTARLGRALRSFIHPNAIRTLPWDVQHASTVRPMLTAVRDRHARGA